MILKRRTGWLVVFILAFLAVRTAGPQAKPRMKCSCTFVNNTAFSKNVLEPLIEEHLDRFEKEGYAESFLDDAAFVLKRYYRSNGFPEATVDFKAVRTPDRVRALFTIHEGFRAKIGRVVFFGNFEFTTSELLHAADITHLRKGENHVQREVDREVEKLRQYYIGQGFPDVKVEVELDRSPGSHFRNTDETVQILVTIDEGVRVYLSRIHFKGNSRLKTASLQKRVQRFLKPRHPYNRTVSEEVRASILDEYANRGFPFTSITVTGTMDRKKKRAEVTLVIDEKSRARFGTITLAGNELTSDIVIRRNMLFREGEWFSQENVWKTQIELYNTGLFTRVTLKPGAFVPDREDARNGALAYEVLVEEQDPWQVDIYAGYGSYERVRGGVAVRNINVFGTGRTIEGKLQASFKNGRGEMNITDPQLLGKDLTLSLRNSYEERDHPSFYLKRFESIVEVGIPFSRRLEAKVGYQFTASDTSDIKNPEDHDLQGSIGISGINVGFTYDRRDSPVDPSSGYYVGATYEVADRSLGSELNFHRVTGNVKGFLTLAEGWVVAIGARGGIIAPSSDTKSIPIQERFFNGGESSVRSFKRFELGPMKGSDPQGGQAFLVLNTELRFPIYNRIGGAIFGDAGNVRRDYRDFGLGALQYGVGAGVYVKTPVGPVRFDLAVNPDPEKKEDRWNMHLSVGYSF